MTRREDETGRKDCTATATKGKRKKRKEMAENEKREAVPETRRKENIRVVNCYGDTPIISLAGQTEEEEKKKPTFSAE
jgi:hypothetical protein